MKIAVYGSSLLSSWWNGTATYYRGLLRDLASRGHEIIFYEPDALDRQSHRDMEPPPWAKSVVYPATSEGLLWVLEKAGDADAVIKASGVGAFDDELIDGIVEHARPDSLRIFWDVDAAATLSEMSFAESHPVRRNLQSLDLVLTYGGGQPVVQSYLTAGAPLCVPVYNALDPATHHPADPDPRYDSDLSLLANRLPDREVRVEQFFLAPALSMPERRFLIAGNGWETKCVPQNVARIGHIPTADHNAFNCTPLAVLNVARESIASIGYSPSTRMFEAAGAAACVITDAWEGIEQFLTPETEVLVARDGQDVAQYVATLTPVVARAIGEAALRRVLSEHTYAHRGAQVDELLTRQLERKRATAPVSPSGVPA